MRSIIKSIIFFGKRTVERLFDTIYKFDTRLYNFMRARFAHVTPHYNRLALGNRGDGYMDVVMKILIAVVVGGILLGLMRTVMPEIFQTLVDKIQTLVGSVDLGGNAGGAYATPAPAGFIGPIIPFSYITGFLM